MEIDTIDHAILGALQKKGRMSNADLAHQVGLSQSACLRRVRTLEQAGIIEGYTALLNQKVSGRPQSVFVQITLVSQESHDLEEFEAHVIECPEVMECYLMTGDADYLLRVIVKDAADYERLHREFLTRLPGVDRVKSSFALRVVRKRSTMPLE